MLFLDWRNEPELKRVQSDVWHRAKPVWLWASAN